MILKILALSLIFPSLSIAATISTINLIRVDDCEAETPTAVGDLCIETGEGVSPLHVATATTSGTYEAVVLSEVTEPFGGFHISTTNASETSIATAEVFVKIAGTCTAHELNLFTNSGCQATLTATEDHNILVNCFAAVTAAGNNKIFHFRIVEDEEPTVAESINHSFPFKLATGADVRGISFAREIEMTENGTIDIYIANITDTTNVTVEALHCQYKGL